MTSTPSSYTLSLHDALPISGTRYWSRTVALIAARVHRGDRTGVEKAGGEPSKPEGYGLIRSRAWRRGYHFYERWSGTGRVRGSVVDAIGRQVGQRTSVGIRGGRDPGGVEDPGFHRDSRQESSAERQTERPPRPGNHGP